MPGGHPRRPADGCRLRLWLVIGTDAGRPIIWHNGAISGFISIEARYPVDDVTVIILGNQMNADITTILGGISAKIFNAA